ncbi:hypothetical protein PR003_g19116 [Phytophthora rubi]|uniref:Secreted protein n=1 Tax=Phytophthora rubi TaxID=129364 RepID=A0A6A4E048_9STRA|nr:hypothetical protein PR001_g18175 [Phytophthora rubi]KAE9314948.1 hypothetical protein PR003_g19116 [Phytophthora rubi]
MLLCFSIELLRIRPSLLLLSSPEFVCAINLTSSQSHANELSLYSIVLDVIRILCHCPVRVHICTYRTNNLLCTVCTQVVGGRGGAAINSTRS